MSANQDCPFTTETLKLNFNPFYVMHNKSCLEALPLEVCNNFMCDNISVKEMSTMISQQFVAFQQKKL